MRDNQAHQELQNKAFTEQLKQMERSLEFEQERDRRATEPVIRWRGSSSGVSTGALDYQFEISAHHLKSARSLHRKESKQISLEGLSHTVNG
jgi:hypothetical protein